MLVARTGSSGKGSSLDWPVLPSGHWQQNTERRAKWRWRSDSGEHAVAVEGTTTDAAESPVETVSKIAALTSVLLILGLQFTVHPGVSWSLRVLFACALTGGWVLGRVSSGTALVVVIGLAPVMPMATAAVAGGTGSAGGADPVAQSVWLAMVVGALLPSMCFTRWSLPVSWRVLLGGWALMLSLAWPIVVAREIAFDLRVFGDTATINSWAGMSASEVSSWIMYVVLVQLVGLLWLDAIMPKLRTWSERGLPAVVHGLWIGATVSSLVALYQGVVDLEFLSSAAWASLGRATGLMLDANAYGMVAALAAPLAAVVTCSLQSRVRWFCAAGFLINWGGVWMSGSRTALLCALVGTVAFVMNEIRRRPMRRVIRVSVVGVLTALLIALALAVTLSRTTTPFERTEEFVGRSPWQVAETLVARGHYGEIAARMIWEYPLTGVGVGTYHWLAPDYLRATFNQELAFDNAQNWWRHQLAELGLLGALPVLAWSIVIVWLAIRGARGARGYHVATVRGLVVGLGVVSLVGMPTQDPVVLMAFLLLVAMLAVANLDVSGMDVASLDDSASLPFPRGGRLSSVTWIVVGALAVVYAGSHAVLASGSLAVADRAERANYDYVLGLYQEEPHPDGGDFQWTRGDARLRLVKRGVYLTIRAWIQHPDASERPVTLRMSTPCQILFEGSLVDSTPVDIILRLPMTDDRIDLVVGVSRTWSPSSVGSPDTRNLGVALDVDFSDSAAGARVLPTVAESCDADVHW